MVQIVTRVHTGGNKEFVYEGNEKLGDTEPTKDFKEKLREWYNRPRFFSFSNRSQEPVREKYSDNYKHHTIKRSKFKQYILPIILAIIIIVLFVRWSKDGTFEKFGAKLSEIKQNFTSDMIKAKSDITGSISGKTLDIKQEIAKKAIIPQEDDKLLCEQKTKELLKVQQIKSAVDFTYSILEVKEFDSIDKAEEYRKKYVTLNLADPICKNQDVSGVITVMYQIRYNNFYEPITGMRIDKETNVILYDKNCEPLQRGYGC